jgi:CheY-like chemotaxis protein
MLHALWLPEITIRQPQALSQARALKPDVILLDLHMPDQLGFQPELIKSQLALQGSRVLAMSLPIPYDDECKSLAESFGATALLDEANLCDQPIPAILRTRNSSATRASYTIRQFGGRWPCAHNSGIRIACRLSGNWASLAEKGFQNHLRC